MSEPHKRRHRVVIGGPGLPRGAVRLPTGGYIVTSSTMIVRTRNGKQQTIRITPVFRDEPDLKRLALALLDLAKSDVDLGPPPKR